MIRIEVPDDGTELEIGSYDVMGSVEAATQRLCLDAAESEPELAANLLIELEQEGRVRKPFFAIGAPSQS